MGRTGANGWRALPWPSTTARDGPDGEPPHQLVVMESSPWKRIWFS